MKKTLILLTNNNADYLQDSFDRLPLHVTDEVVAIDGGSTDMTRTFLREKGINVIKQEEPGRGEGIRTALHRTEGDVLLFFIPDGAHDPEDIPILFEKIEQDVDMVTASRFAPGGKKCDTNCTTQVQSYLQKALSFLANYLFGDSPQHVSDAGNGFRVIKRGTLNRLNPDQPGDCVYYQLTIRALKLHCKITEIPTVEKLTYHRPDVMEELTHFINCLKIFMVEIGNGYKFERKVVE